MFFSIFISIIYFILSFNSTFMFLRCIQSFIKFSQAFIEIYIYKYNKQNGRKWQTTVIFQKTLTWICFVPINCCIVRKYRASHAFLWHLVVSCNSLNVHCRIFLWVKTNIFYNMKIGLKWVFFCLYVFYNTNS